jgi:hypothetical protein
MEEWNDGIMGKQGDRRQKIRNGKKHRIMTNAQVSCLLEFGL